MNNTITWLHHPIVHGARFADTVELHLLSKTILDQLYHMDSAEAGKLHNCRQKKLHRILTYAGEHCPFYTNLFRAMKWNTRDLSGFAELPLLDKKIIRSNYQALVSDRIQFIHAGPFNTGGSTGQPLQFLSCHQMGTVVSAHQRYWFEKMGYQEGDRIAAFSGATLCQQMLENNIYWIARDTPDELPYGSIIYSTRYLNQDTISWYIRSLQESGFSFLLGYPSAISEVARYCLDHQITFPQPIKGVQLTAEMVSDEQIELIRTAFQTHVYGQYGHAEGSIYGHTEADKQEYDCSPFVGFVEVLDAHGRHVGVGEEGEIVVTGFWNFAMPFIRYRTEDLAVYGGTHEGVVHLKRLEGRAQNWVLRSDGARIPLKSIPLGHDLKALKNVDVWQITQDQPGVVKVLVVPLPDFSSDDEREIVKKFKDFASITAVVTPVDSIPLTMSGKRRLLLQNIS